MSPSQDPATQSLAHGSPTGDGDPSLDRLLAASVAEYAVFALDRAGRVASWNAGAQRLHQYSVHEIVGQYFAIFYPPDDARAGRPKRNLDAAANDGRFEEEGWRMRKDGSRFWAKVVITPRTTDDKSAGFAAIIRDLTESRAAEELARQLVIATQAHADAERRAAELSVLTQKLEEQARQLESQQEEAEVLAEEFEEANTRLHVALADAEAARDAARDAERFTTGILESIADAFVVHDAAWRFRYINPAAREIFATSAHGPAESLVGRNVWEEYPNLIGSVFEREMRRAKDERVAVRFEAFYPERGEWSELYCYPLPDGGLATQWKNVTARKQAEESTRYLARATEVLAGSLDYETTLGQLAQLVVPELADWCTVSVVGIDGKPRQLALAHADPAKVEMARELARRYPTDWDAPTGAPNVLRTGRPELYREIPDELLAASARDAEHLRMIRELSIRSVILVPLPARGRTVGVLTLISAESRRRYGDADLELAIELGRRAGLAVDHAQLFAAERAARGEAEEANRAKSDFLARMSHELRTPLNAIGGYAELLRMEIQGPLSDAQRDALERVTRNQRHLLALINDILNFARIEKGQITVDLGPVAVHEIVASLEALVAPQLRTKALDYVVTEVDPTLTLRTDGEKVRQILLNLLSNAAKFTPAGGRVTLTVGCDAAQVRIAVHDTGSGIPADRLDEIFEPFVQIERSLARSHEGAGLGLAISRELARALGGELAVASELGAGSTFTLVLPRR